MRCVILGSTWMCSCFLSFLWWVGWSAVSVSRRVFAMSLVAPLWPEKAWFAGILLLLIQPPLTLPCGPACFGSLAASLLPGCQRADPSHREDLKRSFWKLYFSWRAACVLPGCLRSSTLRLFRSQWWIFCGLCQRRGIALVHATVPVVVVFLIHLCYGKGLSVSAVKGCNSALNFVLALKGGDLASFREITMLLRRFLTNRWSCLASSPCLGHRSGSSEFDWCSIWAFTDMRGVFSGTGNSLLADPCLS